MLPRSTETPDRLEPEGWWCWLPMTSLLTKRRMSMSWLHTLQPSPSPCLYFIFLAVPCGVRDLSSSPRNWTHAPCSGSMDHQGVGPLDHQGTPAYLVFKSLPLESHWGVRIFWVSAARTSCLVPCNKHCTLLHHNLSWLYCTWANGPKFGSVTIVSAPLGWCED